MDIIQFEQHFDQENQASRDSLMCRPVDYSTVSHKVSLEHTDGQFIMPLRLYFPTNNYGPLRHILHTGYPHRLINHTDSLLSSFNHIGFPSNHINNPRRFLNSPHRISIHTGSLSLTIHTVTGSSALSLFTIIINNPHRFRYHVGIARTNYK